MVRQFPCLGDLSFEPGNITSPLPEDERQVLLGELSGDWQIETRGMDVLVKRFQFANFVHAMTFANHICALAERFDHHPELVIGYGKASVCWWTHTANGIAGNDFLLARETDAIYNSQSEG